MCSVWKHDVRELKIDEQRKIFTQLKKNGLILVEITGGEPLLRKDLFEFTSLLDELGFLYTINTNGLLLDEDKIIRLNVCKNLLQIAISLDSLDEKKYEMLRGVDGFSILMKNIELLRKSTNKTIKCSMTISRENYKEFENMVVWIKKNNFFLSVFPVNNGAEFYHRSDNSLFEDNPPEVINEIADLFQEIAKKRRKGEPFWEFSEFYERCKDYLLKNELPDCGASRLFMDLHADGSIAVCNDFPSFANLLDIPFEEAMKIAENQMKKIKSCYNNTPCYYTCSYNIAFIAEKPFRYLLETMKVMGVLRIFKRLWN